MSFRENKGQWNDAVRFHAEVSAGAFYLRNTGFTVLLYDTAQLASVLSAQHHHTNENKEVAPLVQTHVYHADFVGANQNPKFIADKALPGTSNYFLGNDSRRWASNCRDFGGVTVVELYPNIDLRYYSEGGRLKYDLLVHPGGDPSRIALRYRNTGGLRIARKSLNIKTSVGTVRELPPYAYQPGDAGRATVSCRYRLKDSVLHFEIPGYDRSKELIIDPTIIFSSFTGSLSPVWGFTATYGPDGSFFGGGIVFGSQFPVSSGAFQTNFRDGEKDMGIIRLSPDGSARIYATYIGGTGDDYPHSLFCDAAGNLLIAGRSASADFPAPVIVKPPGVTGTPGGYNICVMKLNPSGTTLLGGMLIGGSADDGLNISKDEMRNELLYNYGDNGRSEIIADAAGNAYVASCTRSADFPAQGSLGGTQDGIVLKLDPSLSNVLFARHIGGAQADAAYVLALSPVNGNLYVAGGTLSASLPLSGGIGSSNHGDVDGYVTQLTTAGAIVRSTFIGTSQYDQVYGIQFDRTGIPYVMGQTKGSWPRINANYHVDNARQFIAKLQPDLSSFIYSMSFGTSNAPDVNISPTAFLVDRCENVYVSGWGGSTGGTSSAGTLGLPVTPDALVMNPPYNSPSHTDGKDFYFFVLKKNATQQLYGSFFGENNPNTFPDHVDGGTSRFDANGVIYQAVCANGDRPKKFWPTTPGSWSPDNTSPNWNMGMIKIAFNLAGLSAGVQSAIDGVVRDTAGCLPLTVQFRDTVANAVTYEWDFDGDGVTDQTTTNSNAQYTFTTAGSYRVRLIGVDPNSCNLRDTSYVTIRVGVLKARPDFAFRKLNPCDSLKFEFTNLTPAAPSHPFTSNTFTWQFLDEGITETRGPGTFTHNFPRPGSYHVRLTIVDTSFCNAPESKDTIVNVAVLVKAAFRTPATGCAPYNAVFTNTSDGGQRFLWNFGDNTTSTDFTPPPHFYATPGDYVIRLTVIDSGTCNIIDSTRFTIRLLGKPVAGIGNVSPQPPIPNTAIGFANTSSPDAIRFKWLFGDGDSLLTDMRLPVSHEYNTAGTFDVLLIAYNQAGCPDTAWRSVTTLVEPAIDVPTAFTPLSAGINSIVYPRGFGIATLHFIIWNRWGQKVFESTDRHLGWNGTYKGKLQPMDVYAYTLDVTFVDGKKATKKGDITLIR